MAGLRQGGDWLRSALPLTCGHRTRRYPRRRALGTNSAVWDETVGNALTQGRVACLREVPVVQAEYKDAALAEAPPN